MDTLDQLYADRGELLDKKYFRAQRLITENGGYYPETDFADIDKRVSDITEQIEIIEAVQWLAENEDSVFVSRIGGMDLYLDVNAVKEGNEKIKANYLASVNHANDDFWAARFPQHIVEENDVPYGLSFRETEF
jgi:hypothetical protein